MARKGKVGIDYFSHDVDMLQDKKIKILKAKHGILGYAVFIRLLEELYREEGYFLQIDEDFNILFSDDNNLDYNVYILILNDCIEKGLFDKNIYEKYGILTSKRIQKNYCSATERRKEVEFIKHLLLIDVHEKYNLEKVNVNILVLNDNIEALNDDIGTQSKEKEKVNKKEIRNTVAFDKSNINEFFEKCWGKYPSKKGKGQVSDTQKKNLYKIGDEIERCIQRYIEYVKANDWLKYQNGSTFFNSGYMDYLDSEVKKENGTSNNDNEWDIEERRKAAELARRVESGEVNLECDF